MKSTVRKAIHFAKGRSYSLEKYLGFDVPVEDFSIVHMFECQTNLYKPIQDLHMKTQQMCLVSIRPVQYMILQGICTVTVLM